MRTRFYKCPTCGNVVMKFVDSKVPIVCCGKPMEELTPNIVDAATDIHIPTITRLDDHRLKVDVGSVPHPMTAEHHLEFIYVETSYGGIRVDLTDSSEAVVCTCEGRLVAIYAYCNLHGLWVTQM
ncbi:MAG: desulfoferrodoxin [Alistipes sp.]|nr:desulfoferrodoxin [Alistipes sp.]